MNCPFCSEAALVEDTRDMPYVYKGEATVVPAVAGEFCPACGEVVLDGEESRRVSAAMLTSKKR